MTLCSTEKLSELKMKSMKTRINLLFLLLQECYLENDQTSMFHVAKSLMSVQALYGIIPNIYGKGDCAKVNAFGSLCVLVVCCIVE